MQSIRIDKKIIEFIKKVKCSRFEGKTMTMIATEALYGFCGKDQKCFACPFHRDQLVGIETGRQSLALKAFASGVRKVADDGWIKVDNSVMDAAKKYAESYGRSARIVFHQAIVEYLTMPSQCKECPFNKEPPKHG